MAFAAESKQDNAGGMSVSSTAASESSVSLHIGDQKQEASPVDESIAASEADAPPPMFHKPPPRQFLLIMIA